MPLSCPNPVLFGGLILTVDPRMPTVASVPGNANRALYQRLITGCGPITKIGLNVFVSAGNICVGAYRNTGVGRASKPGARLATSGSLACPIAGWVEISLLTGTTLAPGDWLALSVDDPTSSFIATTNFSIRPDGDGLCTYQEAAFPLPDPAVSTSGLFSSTLHLIGIP